jgi:hypothetical protein
VIGDVCKYGTEDLHDALDSARAEVLRLRKLVSDASVEIHFAEVQRDNARASAKAIILDLIEERSALELKCWLVGPDQFKLAVLARLEKWQ